MPNGDIVGSHFHIMYKLYPDEMEYTVMEKFLDKMISNVYVLKDHIYPGYYFNIFFHFFSLVWTGNLLKWMKSVIFQDNACRKKNCVYKKKTTTVK